MSSLSAFLSELRRRKVVRVAIVYAVVAWAVIQIAHTTFPHLGLPDWMVTAVIALAALGYPIALVLAWAFEITPDGVKRAARLPASRPVAVSRHSALTSGVGIGILVALVGFGAYAQLGPRDGGVGSRGGTADSALADRSIAVLPFANLSEEPGSEYFSLGIAEEIQTALSAIADLRVSSRTSVLRYRDTGQSVRAIAAELGVATILEGSVRRAGDQLRISAQLIEAATDRPLWAETYNRVYTAEALFDLQAEIARRIAGALHATLSPAETDRLERRPTDNLVAYDLYLQAEAVRSELAGLTGPPAARRAISLLRSAIDLDPEFALAHVRMSSAFGFLRLLEGLPEYADSAHAYLDRALELDPEDPDALLQQARRLGLLRQARALETLERVLRANPNHVEALVELGAVHREMGRYAESLDAFRRALALEPNNPWRLLEVGLLYQRVGAFDEARPWFERAVRMAPELPPMRGSLLHLELLAGRREVAVAHHDTVAAILPDAALAWEIAGDIRLRLHDFEGARENYERMRALLPEDQQVRLTGQAFLHMRDGRPDLAEPLLRSQEARARGMLERGQRAAGHEELARVHAIRGDRDRAAEALAAAAAAGWDRYHEARIDPRLAILDGHARYESIMSGVLSSLEAARATLPRLELPPFQER